jgi:TolB protein
LPLVAFYYIIQVLTGVNAFAQSDVYLAVRAGGSGLIRVGIGGFESEKVTDTFNTVNKTIENDLYNCGLFEVKTLSDSIENAAGSLFEKWKTAGASYYLLGEESDNGNSVIVKLFDLKTALTLFNEEYRIINEKPWYSAHVIVDDIIEHFTGIRGSMASQIAFIRTSSAGSDEIFLIDADGRNPRQLTFSRTLNMSPSWSPDGNTICYSSLSSNNWLIMMINIHTGQSVNISRWSGLNSAPEWSTVNPGLLAFTSSRDGNAEIYTCQSNGNGIRRLTNHLRIDSSPTWSPDGKLLAFTSDRTGAPKIYTMNSDGTNPRRLTLTLNAHEESPYWSPRGDRIAFVIMSDFGFDIATAATNGDNVTMLTYGQSSNEDPHWSPDGLRIVFSSNRTGKKNLYIMNWDGSNVRPLTIDGNSYSPAWAPADSGNDVRISSVR